MEEKKFKRTTVTAALPYACLLYTSDAADEAGMV